MKRSYFVFSVCAAYVCAVSTMITPAPAQVMNFLKSLGEIGEIGEEVGQIEKEVGQTEKGRMKDIIDYLGDVEDDVKDVKDVKDAETEIDLYDLWKDVEDVKDVEKDSKKVNSSGKEVKDAATDLHDLWKYANETEYEWQSFLHKDFRFSKNWLSAFPGVATDAFKNYIDVIPRSEQAYQKYVGGMRKELSKIKEYINTAKKGPTERIPQPLNRAPGSKVLIDESTQVNKFDDVRPRLNPKALIKTLEKMEEKLEKHLRSRLNMALIFKDSFRKMDKILPQGTEVTLVRPPIMKDTLANLDWVRRTKQIGGPWVHNINDLGLLLPYEKIKGIDNFNKYTKKYVQSHPSDIITREIDKDTQELIANIDVARQAKEKIKTIKLRFSTNAPLHPGYDKLIEDLEEEMTNTLEKFVKQRITLFAQSIEEWAKDLRLDYFKN